MKYNDHNLVVSSTITSLEDKLQELVEDINCFKTDIQSKFNELNIEMDPDASLLEAINNLKQLHNATDIKHGSIYNGEAYDLKDEKINKNEIKFVALVKPGQTIEFSIGYKTYTKPANAYQTGINHFITVDWGDGVATQGLNYFCHTYENIDASFKTFNEEYKQVIVTVKPTCYLEEEDIIMPNSISFHEKCRQLILGININFTGITSEYYQHSYPIIQLEGYGNLRYYYTTEAYLNGYSSFEGCYRLKKIKADKLYMQANSYFTFRNCWSLIDIDADIVAADVYDTTSRWEMFYNCYNLSTIKSLNFGIVNKETNYHQIFINCFKLQEIPQLIIDCKIARANDFGFFINCYSLINPFKYLKNTNMLRNAQSLFSGCHQITEAPEELDLSLATNTSGLFRYCVNMHTAPKRLFLDETTNCERMFGDCYNLQQTPRIITASKCTNVSYLFEKCYALQTVNCDLDFPNISNNFARLFDYCYSLESFECDIIRLGNNDIKSGHLDVSRYLFSHSIKLKKLPKQEFSIRFIDASIFKWAVEEFSENINISINTGVKHNFKTLANVKKMPKVINIPNVTSASIPLFKDCKGLTEINDLTINVPNATNINSMFEECTSLVSINNLTINAQNATSIAWLFRGCKSLKTLNNVRINLKPDSNIDMSCLFYNCHSLETIPDLGFSYEECASTLYHAFYSSGIKEAIFNKPFKKLTNLTYAFNQCKHLKTIKMIIENNNTTDYNYWINSVPSLKNVDLDITWIKASNMFNNIWFTQATTTTIKMNFHKTIHNNIGHAITFNNYTFLHSFELYDYANTGNISLDNNWQLTKVLITFKENTSANIYLRYGTLSVEALNKFFESLPRASSNKTLYLKGQENVNKCNQKIATDKGWVINTTT